MKLLVSLKNANEAKEAVKGGADIIDVKNPEEGSLGASFPWVIREVVKLVPKNIETSATIGDIDFFKPGTVALAAHSTSELVDYVKAGFLGMSASHVYELARVLKRCVEEFGKKLVLATYAENKLVRALGLEELVEIASSVDADVVLVDTILKDERSVVEKLGVKRLREFVEKAHSSGLKAAIAGSLSEESLRLLREEVLGVDVIGVRSAVCVGGRGGELKAELVARVKQLLR